MDVSVVVPTYMEASNIAEVIDRTCNVLEGYQFEIIVVDDDSPDLTWQTAESAKASHPEVEVLRRVGKSGRASAVLEGMRACAGRVICVMDGDSQHDEEALCAMADSVLGGTYDMCVGERENHDGTYGHKDIVRAKLSCWGSRYVSFLMPLMKRTSDPMSEFYAVSRNAYLRSPAPFVKKALGYRTGWYFLGLDKNLSVCGLPYVFRARNTGATKLNYKVALGDLFGAVSVASFRLYL